MSRTIVDSIVSLVPIVPIVPIVSLVPRSLSSLFSSANNKKKGDPPLSGQVAPNINGRYYYLSVRLAIVKLRSDFLPQFKRIAEASGAAAAGV